MSNAHQEDGFSFRIWSDDHEPAHVHAWKAGAVAKIEILTLEVHGARRMKPKDLRRALEIVEANREKLLTEWRRVHGRGE